MNNTNEIKAKFSAWWTDITQQGDPSRKPNLAACAYEAGWKDSLIAALESAVAKSDEDETDCMFTPGHAAFESRQTFPPAEACATCGGSKVDPGGLPVCRECRLSPNRYDLDGEFMKESAYGDWVRYDDLPDAAESAQPNYQGMFLAAIESLAEISAALGIAGDEAACANGNELILGAIARKNAALLAAMQKRPARFLTLSELDSIGVHAEGMDGQQWDRWVQQKFADVNCLKISGGNHE